LTGPEAQARPGEDFVLPWVILVRMSEDHVPLFADLKKASFIERPNRFIVRCEMGDEIIDAYLPNPGRLHELLLPGRELYLSGDFRKMGRKTVYTVVGVKKGPHAVMLHTHLSNEVAERLIRHQQIPSLRGYDLAAREVAHGRSRFDFLLKRGREMMYVEVKSVTLFGDTLAMFPDAKTERGTRHLRELAHIASGGTKTAVIFLIHYGGARAFLPDYHTDLPFAQAFMECRGDILYIPLALAWNDDLEYVTPPHEIGIPWDLLVHEAHDRGSYLLLLVLDDETTIDAGRLKRLQLQAGYYVYVGSAMKSLSKRIERHRRLEKKEHWHIDELRKHAAVLADFPIRSSWRLECPLSHAIESIAAGHVDDFGSSDCQCRSHLYRFRENPLSMEKFIEVIDYFRIDSLSEVRL
jgi:sugar fermentation stimulation protein A